jgi:predicted Holliday junction resolvase-like endonuclease
MGAPIDYIIFEDDRIVFLEVKSGKAVLSTSQKNIKNLILNNKIVWDEMRIN